jgi:hypothetical protein
MHYQKQATSMSVKVSASNKCVAVIFICLIKLDYGLDTIVTVDVIL